MKESEFIWADLSTYDLNKSIPFYEKVFKWTIINNENYYIANNNCNEVAGIYETPDFFKKIVFPCRFFISLEYFSCIKGTFTFFS